MRIDISILNDLIKNKVIFSQCHQTLDINIYSYTASCQYKKEWDKYSLMCRGLILDRQGNIVARAFDKFFNLGEGCLPNTHPESIDELVEKHGSYSVEEKLDGSLGLVFFYKDKWHVATKGSFHSEQVGEAIKMFDDFINFNADKSNTHLFEIIYPENRIVVDYNGERKLVYLGSRSPKTGTYLVDRFCKDNFQMPKKYTEISTHEDNSEGYVLVFEDSFRVKVKFEEYKRLHRLLTGLNERIIWETMRESKSLQKFIENVPDEFHDWVKAISRKLQNQFDEIRGRVNAAYEEISNICTIGRVEIENFNREEYLKIQRRLFKDFQGKVHLLPREIQHIVMMKLKGVSKDFIMDAIWDLIEPRNETTFKIPKE